MSKKRVLCFGDSITWGYTPLTGVRFEPDVRWTGVCQRRLGDDYMILEEGLSGRTTVYDDPRKPCLNGKKGIAYCLLSQKPLDLAVIFLGGNDMKYTDAKGASNGVDELVRIVMGADVIFNVSQPIFPSGPKVLLVSPPHINPEIRKYRPDSGLAARAEESFRFAELYAPIARNRGAWFLDAAEIVNAYPPDCVHIDAEGQRLLGEAIAQTIREIFAE